MRPTSTAGIARPHGVAGQVLDHEPIERLVFVERSNDIVAERPGVVDHMVHFEAGAFAESHHIEPVPAPVLAVARRSEQPIDQSFVGVGRIVAQKCVDFFRRRRQVR